MSTCLFAAAKKTEQQYRIDDLVERKILLTIAWLSGSMLCNKIHGYGALPLITSRIVSA